jgi:hypothetical protein
MKRVIFALLLIAFLAPFGLILGQIQPVPPYPIFDRMSQWSYYQNYYQYPPVQPPQIQPPQNPPVSLSNPTVWMPNGSEFWILGETKNIVWSDNCNYQYGCRYDIYLMSAGCNHPGFCSMSPVLIAGNVAGNSFAWQVGKTALSNHSGSYKVAVCSAGSLSYCDASDHPFTINNAPWPPPHIPVAPSVPNLTPAPGSHLMPTTAVISWTAVSGAQEYIVWAGTTPEGRNIMDRSVGLNTSVSLQNLGSVSGPVYFRLWYRVGGTWHFRDATYAVFRADPSPSGIVMIDPAQGTAISGPTYFRWNSVAGVSEYWVWAGTYKDGRNLFDSSVGLNTAVTIQNIPQSGSLHLRIWYKSGAIWNFKDFTYTVRAEGNVSVISISPQSGASLSHRETFLWNAVSGAEEYWVEMGSASGGKDIHNASTGPSRTVIISNIPQDGRTLYLRVWYRVGSAWRFNDFTYRAGTSSAVNIPPVVSLSANVPIGQVLQAPANIPLEAHAFDSDGTVAMVEFYQNGNLLGTRTARPYTLTAANVLQGTHYFSAIATDNRGARVTSSALRVDVDTQTGGSSVLQVLPEASFYKAPAVVILSVTTQDASVSRVVFYHNNQAVDEDTTRPFQFALANLWIGTHSFRAHLFNSAGTQIGTTNNVTVSVVQ